MNRKLALIIPLVFCLASCMQEKTVPSSSEFDVIPSESVTEQSNEPSSEEISSSEASSEQETSSSEEIHYGFKTFEFRDSKYASTNYGIADSDSKKEAFLEALNSDAGEEFFTDIDVESCFFNIYGTETNSYTLVLGSSSYDGSMTLKTDFQITEIKVIVQLYHKYISYNDSWSVTTSSTLTLNGTSFGLSADEGQAPAEVEKTVTLSKPENRVNIASTDGRILVHSMVVTYIIPE